MKCCWLVAAEGSTIKICVCNYGAGQHHDSVFTAHKPAPQYVPSDIINSRVVYLFFLVVVYYFKLISLPCEHCQLCNKLVFNFFTAESATHSVTTRGVARGVKGRTMPRAPNNWVAPKSPNNLEGTFFITAHLLPGPPNMFLAPGAIKP